MAHTIEDRIKGNVKKFDVISLLRLLMDLGYGPGQISFRGNESICSQSQFVHDVEFFRKGDRTDVVITVNTGLMGVNSSLPSYFRTYIDNDLGAGSTFIDFIGFFDHVLIRNFLCSVYSEINSFFFPSQILSSHSYLKVFDLRSVSSLHQLFSRVFPETGVLVEKAVLDCQTSAAPIRISESLLGPTCVFGRETDIPECGFRVTLYCEYEVTYTRKPWPREVKDKLARYIFPLLGPLGFEMEVDVVLEDQSRCLRLLPDSYLGYDTLQSSAGKSRKVRVFSGKIPKPKRTRAPEYTTPKMPEAVLQASG